MAEKSKELAFKIINNWEFLQTWWKSSIGNPSIKILKNPNIDKYWETTEQNTKEKEIILKAARIKIEMSYKEVKLVW